MSFRAFVSTILILALKSCGAMSLLVAVNAHALDKWEDHQRHIFPGGIVDGGAQVVSILSTGARCDDRADDQAAITKAVATLGSAGGTVTVPRGSCYVGSTVAVTTDNVTIAGEGPGSILRFPSSIGSYLSFTDVSGGGVADLRIEGGGVGTGDLGAAIDFDTVTDGRIANVTIYDPDDVGVRLLDTDRTIVRGVSVAGSDARYAAGTMPYGYILDGAGGNVVEASTGYQLNFGLLIQGPDGTPGDSASARAGTFCRNNVVQGVVIEKAKAHHFSINTCDHNTIANSVAKTYQGAATLRLAFQSKSTASSNTDDHAVHNKFIGNTAEDVDIGFGTNDGAEVQFIGNTVVNAQRDGLWLNGSPRVLVRGLDVEGFNGADAARACVRVEQSTNAHIEGVLCQPDSDLTSAATTSVGVDIRTSSGGTVLDDIDFIGAFDKGIDVGSSINNTQFGARIRFVSATVRTAAIEDDNSTSIYPVHCSGDFLSSSTGVHALCHPSRGLILGRVRVMTPIAVTGGGNIRVNVGDSNSTGRFVSGYDQSASVGTITTLDQTTSPTIPKLAFVDTGRYVTATVAHNGTVSAGSAAFTVEGLPGPIPATVTTTTTSTTTSSTI